MTPLTLLLAAGLFVGPLAAEITTLDDALARLASGATLRDVAHEVGIRAVERIVPGATEDERLESFAEVARAAGADEALGAKLRAVLQAGGAGTAAAVRVIVTLPAEQQRVVLAPEGMVGLSSLLLRVANEGDPVTAAAAVQLRVPMLPALELRSWLGELAAYEESLPSVLALLRAAPQAADQPAAILRALAMVDVELPASADAVFGEVLGALALDPAAATEVLALAQSGVEGPGGAVYRALSQLHPRHWEQAERLLLQALDDAEGRGLAGALLAAAELRVPAVYDVALALSAPDSGADALVRARALEALAIVAHRDAPTLAHFIDLLADPDARVATAAYEALKRKTQLAMAGRREVWRTWWEIQVAADKLPSERPDDHEARMQRQRKSMALRWYLAHDEEPPPSPRR